MDEKFQKFFCHGDHAKVDKWRLDKSIEITKERRKDLYNEYIKKENNN